MVVCAFLTVLQNAAATGKWNCMQINGCHCKRWVCANFSQENRVIQGAGTPAIYSI